MEYFYNLISALSLKPNISIENDKLILHVDICISRHIVIIECLKYSFILFKSDIEIYEILLEHKKHIKYDITEHTYTIHNITCRNKMYGITIQGILKSLFSKHISRSLLQTPFIEKNISCQKYLRKRSFKNIHLSFMSFIGIFNNEFILVEIDREIYAIDQHGLHERILYERFKGDEKKRKGDACRKAIKFGDVLEPCFVVYLLNEMRLCKHPFICAHGRPIICVLQKVA